MSFIKLTNTRRAKNQIEMVIRKEIFKSMESFSLDTFMKRKIKEDFLRQYIDSLSDYSELGTPKREPITELYYKALGKKYNEAGSFTRDGARRIAMVGTKTGITEKVTKRKTFKDGAVVVGSYRIDITSEMTKDILKNLEHGEVTWMNGSDREIAAHLRGLAQKLTDPLERKYMLDYASGIIGESGYASVTIIERPRRYFQLSFLKWFKENKEKYAEEIVQRLIRNIGKKELEIDKLTLKTR